MNLEVEFVPGLMFGVVWLADERCVYVSLGFLCARIGLRAA